MESTSYNRHFEDLEELGEVAETTALANHSNLKDFPEFDQLEVELALAKYSNIVKTDNH